MELRRVFIIGKAPTKEQLLIDVSSSLTWKEIATKHNYTDSRFLRKLSVRWGLPPRRIFFRPTKEAIETLLGDKLDIKEIANRLGYGEGGWSNVYAYCREYGIKFDLASHHEIREISFTDIQKSLVYGTMLGDGNLSRDVSPTLRITHSIKQLGYLDWFESSLSEFFIYRSKPRKSTSGLNHSDTITIGTVCHPFLADVRHLCYPGGKKTVTKEWLDKVDDLALAVWFMDDGSLNKRYGTMVLCTNSFSRKEQELIQEWFLKRYNVPTVLEERRNNQTVIRINSVPAKRLRLILEPHIPECMKYKVTLEK